MGLQDYREIVATAATITTTAQAFSPIFICKDIIKQKGTGNIDSTPFVGGIGITLLMLQHGLILNDPAMIPVNIAGFTLNVIYLSIYLFYCNEKMQVLRYLGKILAGVSVIIGYAQIEREDRIEFNYGIIITALMLTLIGAPLLNLKEIIRSKDTSALPFPMILSGTVVTFLWLLYGIIIENAFIQFQNYVGFTLCAFQLILCLVWPGNKKKSD